MDYISLFHTKCSDKSFGFNGNGTSRPINLEITGR